MKAECLMCGEMLRLVPWHGWIHQGGGVYVVRCDSCGWRGSPPGMRALQRCPSCDRRKTLRDDHIALPSSASVTAGGN
jgi:hypothetical protein